MHYGAGGSGRKATRVTTRVTTKDDGRLRTAARPGDGPRTAGSAVRRGPGLVTAVVLCFAVAAVPPAAAEGGDNRLLTVISDAHPVYQAIADGLRAALGHETTVATVQRNTAPLLRLLSSEPWNGVVAIGPAACTVVSSSRASNRPTVLCLYDHGRRTAPLLDDRNSVVHVVTPLADYGPVVERVFPRARRIAFIHRTPLDEAVTNLDHPTVTVRGFDVASWNELKDTTDRAIAWADLLWLPADLGLNGSAIAYVIKASLQARTPLLSSSPRLVRGGALMGLERPPAAVGAAAAARLRRPSSQQPPTEAIAVRLVVNGRVAEYLGIDLPSEFAGRPVVDVNEDTPAE